MNDKYEEVGKTETTEKELDLKLVKFRKGTQKHYKVKEPEPRPIRRRKSALEKIRLF